MRGCRDPREILTILRPCTTGGTKGGSARGHIGVKGCRKMGRGGRRGKAGEGEQLRTFSTDCPLTNISRLALCIHVQCTLTRVQSTTPLALRFASPWRGHGETSLREDGVEFKQLDEGPVRDKRSGIRGAWFVVLAWGCGLAVEPGLRQHRSAAVGGESRAELSGDHDLAGAMERPRAEAGAGRLRAQEVELEAEAEAVVVLGPRSVLLPSVVAEVLVGVEAAAWLRAWAGMSMEAREGLLDNSWVVKLKREGLSLPLGSLTLGSRSSSKKEWAQASRGVRRAVGVYSSRREHRAMASGGVRGRNTLVQGCALIWGNLNSV